MTSWLLVEGSHIPDAAERARVNVLSIQAGLLAGVGAGGAIVLLLTARKQWRQEREQRHQEEVDAADQLHRERVANDTNQDAIERRITELYTKAIDQLGSERPAVRLGGLYALERLANSEVNHRQTIVNVVCAYLRMSPNPIGVLGDVSSAENIDGESEPSGLVQPPRADYREEREVRLAAQRMLAEHLRPEGLTFWDAIRVDLTGATLTDVNFRHCNLAGAEFGGATFEGDACFAGATFGAPARFSQATFNGTAFFREVMFCAYADFTESTFAGDAWFDGSVFKHDAGFRWATFRRDAWFGGIDGWGSLRKIGYIGVNTFALEGASFDGEAVFQPAAFHGSA